MKFSSFFIGFFIAVTLGSTHMAMIFAQSDLQTLTPVTPSDSAEQLVQRDVESLQQYCETPLSTEAVLEDLQAYTSRLSSLLQKSCGQQQKVYLFGIPYDPMAERIPELFGNFIRTELMGQIDIGFQELSFALGNAGTTDILKYDVQVYANALDRLQQLLAESYQFCAIQPIEGGGNVAVWQEVERHYLAYRTLYLWLMKASDITLPPMEYEGKQTVFSLSPSDKSYIDLGYSCSNISQTWGPYVEGKASFVDPKVDTLGQACAKESVVIYEILDRVARRMEQKEKLLRTVPVESMLSIAQQPPRLSREEINQRRSAVEARPASTVHDDNLKKGGMSSTVFRTRLRDGVRLNPFFTTQYNPENKGLCTDLNFGFGRVQLSFQNLSSSLERAQKAITDIGDETQKLFQDDPDKALFEVSGDIDPSSSDMGMQTRLKARLNVGLLFAKVGSVLNGSSSVDTWLKATTSTDLGTLFKTPPERIQSGQQIDENTVKIGQNQKLTSTWEESLAQQSQVDQLRTKQMDALLFHLVYGKVSVALTLSLLQAFDGVQTAAEWAEQDIDEGVQHLECFTQRVSGKQNKKLSLSSPCTQ